MLLLLSLGFAILSLQANGLTWNGIGPAVLAIAGAVWELLLQWLRHRSYLKHIDSGFAPGTQHLAIAACLGWALATFAAVIWAMIADRSVR